MNKKQYLTVADIASRSYQRAGLPKEWTTHLGDPEMGQTIIIWGQSASGKSYYAMKLAKGFAEAGHRVLYYPLEEGITASYNEKIVNLPYARCQPPILHRARRVLDRFVNQGANLESRTKGSSD